jgi:hypothetical protein
MGKVATATARVVAKASAKTPLKVVKPTVEKSITPAPVSLRSQVVMCTPSVAKQLRAACHFERQRALSDDHIARLAEEMTRGSFVAGTQIFMGVLPSREMLILNGNHTLEAVAFSGVPTALTFTYCPVADENEAGRLYAQFDIHRVRSWGDAYKAYGFNDGIPGDWVTKSGAALGIIAAKFQRPGDSPMFKSREIRSHMIRDYTDTIIHLVAVIRSGARHIMPLVKRRAVLAVALETMRYQPSAAAEFWGSLVRDDGLKNGDPAKALLSHLRNNSASTGGHGAVLQSNAAASAWNAFHSGKQLSFVRPKEVTTFRLAGTPWVDPNYDPTIPPADQSFSKSVQVDAVVKPSFSTGVSFSKDGDRPVILYDLEG